MLYTVCFHLPTFPLLTSLVDVVTAGRLVVDTSSAVETEILGPAVVMVDTLVLGPAVETVEMRVLGPAVIVLGSAVVVSFTRLPVVTAATKACVTQWKHILVHCFIQKIQFL